MDKSAVEGLLALSPTGVPLRSRRQRQEGLNGAGAVNGWAQASRDIAVQEALRGSSFADNTGQAIMSLLSAASTPCWGNPATPKTPHTSGDGTGGFCEAAIAAGGGTEPSPSTISPCPPAAANSGGASPMVLVDGHTVGATSSRNASSAAANPTPKHVWLQHTMLQSPLGDALGLLSSSHQSGPSSRSLMVDAALSARGTSPSFFTFSPRGLPSVAPVELSNSPPPIASSDSQQPSSPPRLQGVKMESHAASEPARPQKRPRKRKKDIKQHNLEEYRRRARIRDKFTELCEASKCTKRDRYNILCHSVELIQQLRAKTAALEQLLQQQTGQALPAPKTGPSDPWRLRIGADMECSVPLLITQLDGRIVHASTEFAAAFGYAADQLHQRSIFEFSHRDHRRSACEMVQALLLQAQPQTQAAGSRDPVVELETVWLRANGSSLPVHVTAATVRSHGKLSHFSFFIASRSAAGAIPPMSH